MSKKEYLNELRKELAAGSESAYKKLYTNYYSFLCNQAYKICANKEESEEIVQQAIFSFWKNRNRIESIINIDAYLVQIVKNEAIKIVKERKIISEIDVDVYLSIKEKELQFNDQFYHNELAADLDAAIRNLPEKSKEAFLLKRIEGKSLEEVALIMNISVKGVERNITRALSELKLKLKNCFIFML